MLSSSFDEKKEKSADRNRLFLPYGKEIALMRPQYCFFDLDGTVIDSSPGILKSFNYALQRQGLPLFTERDTATFIGPPLIHVFCNHFGLSQEDGMKGVNDYRVCYRAGGMLDCRVYDGVRELIDALRGMGIKCVLATCKPHEFATAILAHHGLLDRFEYVSGPEMDGTRGEKDEVIAYALRQLDISDPASVLMLGDRANDVWGAAENSIDCLGVLWGFGTERELLEAGAVALCKAPADVLPFFQKNCQNA